MKHHVPPFLMMAIFLVLNNACQNGPGDPTTESGNEPASFIMPELSGSYLGQQLPGPDPGLFAPGVVNTGMFTRDVAISPDGKEIYYCVAIGNYTYSTILYVREKNGRWQSPEIVPFSGGPGIIDFEPAFSPDGSQLYFLSTRPDGEDEASGDQDIWVVERAGDGWGEPKNLGSPVNTDGGEFFPSLTEDGTLYFTRNERGSAMNQIFRSRLVNGVFQDPELLPPQVNCGTNRFNAFVAPDEQYIIVPAQGMEDAFDGVDYYIVFRNSRDQWSDPINMGPMINSDNARGWSPYVSPDKKVFFFMATRTREIEQDKWNYQNLRKLYQSSNNGNADIYWMDAGFIGELKKQAVFR